MSFPPKQTCLAQFLPLWMAKCLIFSAGIQGLSAQTGITNQAGLTLFRTGGSEPLLTLAVPIFIPQTTPAADLRFNFGFSTSEPDAASTFFDSFSVTLQNARGTTNALLFTTDRSGTVWAPSNPGGMTLDPASIIHEPIRFSLLASNSFSLSWAFALSFSVPLEFLGQTNTLFFDLFDNQNSSQSASYYSQFRLFLPLWLQSSAAGGGPFADETGVDIDAANLTVTLPKFSVARFFRIRSNIPTQITRFGTSGDDLSFRYAFRPNTLVFEWSLESGGPFFAQSNAVINLDDQTVEIPGPGETNGVYRLRSEAGAALTSRETMAGGTRFRFVFQPTLLVLESSASAQGPFSREEGLRMRPESLDFRMPKFGLNRFYRLRSVAEHRIVRVENLGAQWRFHYQ